ncbi:response regulator transcription factor [Salinibacter ruber]|uniref:response regulator transcription factor n=1 Tax=Salinibacter ruber TaxID=146919 RepID=UPI0013C2D582|nr:helix-turn-helix transcriptional regulator [Salinibacter ruber]
MSSSNLAFSLGMGARKTALELALRNGEKTASDTTVSNDPDGHEQLLRWLQEQGAGSEKTGVCMEASGDFEKATSRRLYEEDYRVSARVRFPIDELTSKELDVFKMVGRGMTAGAIADQLGLARKTVKTHRREAKEKLGYETIHEVTSHAARWVQAGVQAEEQANPA